MLAVARHAARARRASEACCTVRRGKTSLNVIMMKDSEWAPQGTELSVSRGFARNYLYPRGLAVPATEASRGEHVSVTKDEYEKQRHAKRKEKRIRRRYVKMNLLFVREADGTGIMKEPLLPEHVLHHAERRHGVKLTEDALELVGTEWPLRKLGNYAVHLHVPEGYTIPQEVKVEAPEFNMDLVAEIERTDDEYDE